MIPENKKIEKFIEEINKTANDRISAIETETEKYVKSELKKAKKQARQEIGLAQFSELEKLNEKNNASLSEAEKSESERLLARRCEITEEVFSEAKRRISDFTGTDSYKAFLLASAENLCREIGKGTFYLSGNDEKFFDDLASFCHTIQIDNTIVFGGIKAVNEEKGLAADDTLDSRLAAEKQAFYEVSGLSVTI